jgi:hypothetical protein
MKGMHHQPPTIFGVAKEVFVAEGVLGFWKGNGANVARIIPNKGFLFAFNDT